MLLTSPNQASEDFAAAVSADATEAAVSTAEVSGVYAAGTFSAEVVSTGLGTPIAVGLGAQVAVGTGATAVGAGLIYAGYQDLFANHPPADEGADEGGSREPPVVAFDFSKYPELSDNIWQAQRAGHPTVLHYNGGDGLADQNRANALSDLNGVVRRPQGYSFDEYPFASTFEGGTGAWVGLVPTVQQSAQGGVLSRFYNLNQLGIGDPFGVAVINHP